MGIMSTATNALQSILGGETGLSWALSEGRAGNADTVLRTADIKSENVSIDVAEKSPVRYPVVLIYCDRLVNEQREKFAIVSGTLSVVVEVRASGNSIAAVSGQTLDYVEAILAVLDCHKGEWATGIQYCGGYDVSFQQIKRGGSQLLQVTRIALPLQICKR